MKLTKLLNKMMSTKYLAIILVAFFIISLIPLIIISFYNVPCADDFSYGNLANHAFRETGSVIEAVKAAGQQVATSYETWQGTFSAIFLMALQPSVFGMQFYFLSTFVLLGGFIFSNYYFFKVLCCDCFSMPKYHMVILATVMIALSIQFVPSPVQAFYWFNGSVYYTFFYAMVLCMCALLIKFVKRGSVVHVILASFLAICIGGGNYPSALLACLLLGGAFLLTTVKRSRPVSKRVGLLVCWILESVAFAFNVLAPGNAVRQAHFTDRPSVLGAVW